MKGLKPEAYGLTLDDIGLTVAFARRDGRPPVVVIRERYLVSDDQAEQWFRAAEHAGVVPDPERLKKPR